MRAKVTKQGLLTGGAVAFFATCGFANGKFIVTSGYPDEMIPGSLLLLWVFGLVIALKKLSILKQFIINTIASSALLMSFALGFCIQRLQSPRLYILDMSSFWVLCLIVPLLIQGTVLPVYYLITYIRRKVAQIRT